MGDICTGKLTSSIFYHMSAAIYVSGIMSISVAGRGISVTSQSLFDLKSLGFGNTEEIKYWAWLFKTNNVVS